MELVIGAFEKSFYSEEGTLVFRLSVPELTINGGTRTFVMGHNGSGKSVFLKVLHGLLSPDSKEATLTVAGKAVRDRTAVVSRVPQDATEILATDLTVSENLLLREPLVGVPAHLRPLAAMREGIISELSEHGSLVGKADEPVGFLSVGQRQRLAFLCATVGRQPVLILDEFLAAADNDSTTVLRELARAYAEERQAVVLVVSHDPRTALEDAQRILVLRQGRLTHDLLPGSEQWTPEFLREVI